MTKNELRRAVRAVCAVQSETWLEDASRRIVTLLEESVPFRRAEVVALYWSLPGEVSTHALIRRWYKKKCILLPVMDGPRLVLKRFTGDECLEEACFGIREPSGEVFDDLDAVGLVVVPGLGFDRGGNRLGYGKGYYDRLLAETGAIKIGVCFDFQLLDAVPAEAHDIPMDLIISGSPQRSALFSCPEDPATFFHPSD